MPLRSLKIALTPCPNDTFVFHAWISAIVGSSLPLEPVFADIDQLNTWGLQKKYPLTKVSLGSFARMQDDYDLLECGCALGIDVGPKVIATHSNISYGDATVLIPGENTTAHLLTKVLLPPFKRKIFCRYDEIFTRLEKAQADMGVIIHESRFTFSQAGFFEVADLGFLWREKFDMPLPLGGIALRKDHAHMKQEITALLKASLLYAWENPFASHSFVQKYAQERNFEVIKNHIDLYVNNQTLCLSDKSKEAIALMLKLGASR